MNSREKDIYPLFSSYQKKCQPYACPISYPDSKTCSTQQIDTRSESECIPPGYQPKRPNPGGLKFYMYDYPYHTAGGKPLSHPGMGWYKYEHTGKYYTWWT